jgi:hypothetical protein
MKTILLTALALLLATPAWTCDDDIHACVGKVMSYTGHVVIVTDNSDCYIYKKALINRLLKVCPQGSQCEVLLHTKDYRNLYHGHGVEPAIEIIKLPSDGGMGIKP